MRKYFIFFFILIAASANAQNVAFVVFYTKGAITKAGTAGLLKKGDKLFAKDQITVANGAQIILICKNLNTLKLTAKGKFSVADLNKQCDKKSPSVAASYFSYVWNEFTSPHGNKETDPSHYMRNAGAVSRGCPNVQTKLAFDTLYYRTGSLPLYYSTTIREPYFSMYSEGGDSLIFTKLQFQPLDKLFEKVKNTPGEYYWQITDSTGNGCEPNYLKILSSKTYASQIVNLLKDLPAASPAASAFMKGFILEENHFAAEAFSYYKQAYKLEPSNKAYQNAQARFYE